MNYISVGKVFDTIFKQFIGPITYSTKCMIYTYRVHACRGLHYLLMRLTDVRPITAQLLLNLSTWLISVKRQRTSSVDDFGVVRRNQNVANELSISLASVLVSIYTDAGNTSDIIHEMLPTRSIRLHVGLLWTGTNMLYCL